MKKRIPFPTLMSAIFVFLLLFAGCNKDAASLETAIPEQPAAQENSLQEIWTATARTLKQVDRRAFSPENLGSKHKKKHPVPFHATFLSKAVVFPPQPDLAFCGSDFPVVHVNQVLLSGNATHMGKIGGSISSCADLSFDPPSVSDVRFSFEAANGDWLYIVDFVITGGTGRFEHARGVITSGGFEFLEPNLIRNYLDGEIQY